MAVGLRLRSGINGGVRANEVRRELPKIQDYALIGNGRSAALISRGGSLDWLAWPRFDSGSIFAALLDSDVGGRWSISCATHAEITRRYISDTNVLETRFAAPNGVAVLTDFMPVATEQQKREMLWPEHEIIRRMECRNGHVTLVILFDPRPDYGRSDAAIKGTRNLGWRMQFGRSLLALRSSVTLAPDPAGGLAAEATLTAGESVEFSLTFSTEGPAVLAPLDLVRPKLELTIEWWQNWARRGNYSGPDREEVVRSLLVLKALSYAPSGAIVAAPTTSLPERLGGSLNWDYRFAWLRDAAYTVRALAGLGYSEDAHAFVSWLLHSTRLTRPELRVLYDVYGRTAPAEKELAHLRGYANSAPVRIGNGAQHQLQLDVYGEVLEAVSFSLREEKELDRETQKMLRQIGDYVCEHWRQPDSGIWEPRGELQHYTHSRLLCWVALDRLLQFHERGQLDRVETERLSRERELIRNEITELGWNAELETYTQIFGGDTVDASLFFLALYEFEQASSARMQQTYRRIREKLVPRPGLVYRNEESLTSGEGAFAVCSFWEVDFLARGGGSLEEARVAFRRAAAHANDLGLFAEEIVPKNGDALGNFPQAYSHLGMVNAAMSLGQREEEERPHLASRISARPRSGRARVQT
jgi:GH15 family glucan-1,4-alpha-glucosidase